MGAATTSYCIQACFEGSCSNLQHRATVVCNSGGKSVRVLGRNFTKSMDTFTYNLKGAYYDSSLKLLTWKFMYSHQSSIIIITDKVEFSKPSMFEDALVSQKSGKFTSNSTGYFTDANQTLFVYVISDTPFVLNRTKLTSYKINLTQIGIQLSESVSYAKVTVIFCTKNKSSSYLRWISCVKAKLKIVFSIKKGTII
jgi:hypothetical protein